MSDNLSGKGFIFNFSSIRARIILSFSLIVLGIITLAIFTALKIQSLNKSNAELLNSVKESQRMFCLLGNAVNRTNLLLQQEVIEKNTNHSLKIKKIWEEEITQNRDSLNNFQKTWVSSELKLKYASLQLYLNKLHKYQEELENLIQDETDPQKLASNQNLSLDFIVQINSSSFFKEKVLETIHAVNDKLNEVLELLHTDFSEKQLSIASFISNLKIWEFILIFIFFCLTALLGANLFFTISKKINLLQDKVWAFSRGNIPSDIEISNDETGDVMQGLKELGDNLIKIKDFASTVGHGEFDKDIHVFNDEGELGRALIEMHDGLVSVAIRDKQRNWANEGIALFGNVLREYSSEQVLYDNLISTLVKYLKANQGGLFILSEENEQRPVMELKSFYAYDRKRYIEKEVIPGQGLVGQAWLEKEMIYVEQVAETYVQIVSGLGGANPRSVLIVPLVNNELKVLGAFEIASFNKFEKFELEFTRRVAEMIVSAVSSLKNNERNRRLLEEAQRSSQTLKVQEEEMRQNLEQLITTQEEMLRNQAELTGKTLAINTTLATVELDPHGNILSANDIFLEIFGYEKEELKGKTYGLLVDNQEYNSYEYQRFWQDLLEGEIKNLEIKRYAKNGEEHWFNATYTPVKDKDGYVFKIINLALDTTEQKRLNLNYKSQLEAINKSNALIEFDPQGNILFANELYLNLFGYNIDELKDKYHNIFVPDDDKDVDTYQDIWEKLSKGNSISGRFRMIGKHGKEIWIYASYNPLVDLNGKVYKILKLAQDITHEIEVEQQVKQAYEILKKQKSELMDANQKMLLQEKELRKSLQQLEQLQSELPKPETN